MACLSFSLVSNLVERQQAKDLVASAFYGWRNIVSTFEDVGKDVRGFVDLLVRDMQMGYCSIALSSDGVNKHAVFFERGYEFGWRTVLVDDVEDDDIRFDVLRRNLDCGNVLELASQFFCMLMVGLEPSDMPLQRVDTGGGQDARLAHRASIHSAKAACAIHESLVIGDQQRSNWGSQSLRETEGDGFEVLGVHRRWQGSGGHGIEEPGSVEVHGDPLSYGKGSDLFDRGERINRAASGIVRIFDADQGRCDAVRVVRSDGGFHLLDSHDSPLTGYPMKLHAGQCPSCALFIANDMTLALDDYFLSRLRV
jgi:hypothetical protein